MTRSEHRDDSPVTAGSLTAELLGAAYASGLQSADLGRGRSAVVISGV
jgi:hypothetical protein